MDSGQLFASMTDQDREAIWPNVAEIAYPIPTLRTFFKDRVYLEVAQSVMKQVCMPVQGSMTTIDAAVRSLWDTAVPMTDSMREECLKPDLLEFWRFSFQYGFEMTDHSRLKSDQLDSGEQPSSNESESRIPSKSELWAHFYALMRARGFKPRDGNRVAAPATTLPAPAPCEYPSDPTEEIEPHKRCGKPYDVSAAADRFALSASSVRQPLVPGRVTAGVLRRAVFDAFFGYLRSTGAGHDQSTFESPPEQTGVAIEAYDAGTSSDAIMPNEGNSSSYEPTINGPDSWDATLGTGSVSESAGLSTASNNIQAYPLAVNFSVPGLPEGQERLEFDFDFPMSDLSRGLDAHSFQVEVPATERSIPPAHIFHFYTNSTSSELDARPRYANDTAAHIENGRKRGYQDSFPDAGSYDDQHAKARRFIREQTALVRDESSAGRGPRSVRHSRQHRTTNRPPQRLIGGSEGELNVPAFHFNNIR